MSKQFKIFLLAAGIIFGILVLLTKPAQNDVKPVSKTDADAPLLCYNKAQCDEYWMRSRQWVEQNSKYPIEQTSAVIKTIAPIAGIRSRRDAAYSYRAFQTGSLADWTAIDLEVSCERIFLTCSGDPEQARTSFKRFVRQ